MNFIWAAVAGILSGILGAMGMGGGGVLIIYLTLFAGIAQVTAQGINLIFFIPSALIALFFYHKKGLIAWKTAFLSAILGVAGAVLGTYASSLLQSEFLGKLFGALLLVMGTEQLFSARKKK